MTQTETTHTKTAQTGETSWQEIRQMARRALSSQKHCVIASTAEDGTPIATPIGSLSLLREPGRALYFPIFAGKTALRLASGRRFCILAVDSGTGFWLRSLFTGRFAKPVGMRLYGTAAGLPRPASVAEQAHWRRRVRPLRFLPGHDKLWGRLDRVQDLTITHAEGLNVGAMSSGAKLDWCARDSAES